MRKDVDVMSNDVASTTVGVIVLAVAEIDLEMKKLKGNLI